MIFSNPRPHEVSQAGSPERPADAPREGRTELSEARNPSKCPCYRLVDWVRAGNSAGDLPTENKSDGGRPRTSMQRAGGSTNEFQPEYPMPFRHRRGSTRRLRLCPIPRKPETQSTTRSKSASPAAPFPRCRWAARPLPRYSRTRVTHRALQAPSRFACSRP